MIGQPAAGILINRVKKILGGAEQSDDCDACTERLQILGEKLLPELLAQTNQEYGPGGRSDVPLNAEKICRSSVAPGFQKLSSPRRSYFHSRIHAASLKAPLGFPRFTISWQ